MIGGNEREPRKTGRLGLLVLAAPTTYWYIAQGPTLGPVATTGLAEVARLRETVVVVITKLGIR